MLKRLIHIIAIILFHSFIVTNSYAVENRFTLGRDQNSIFFEIKLSAGQTIYWIYPGDVGKGSAIDLSNSENIQEYFIIWPFPIVGVKSDVSYNSYYYQGDVRIPIFVEPISREQPIVIKAELEYVICDNQCEFVQQHLDGVFDPKLPQNMPSSFEIKDAKYANDRLSFVASFGYKVESPKFLFASAINENINDITVGKNGNNDYLVTILFQPNTQKLVKGDYEIYSNHAELPGILTLDSGNIVESWNELIKLVITAIIGGFILNFMPCVLPVLSLKLFSFVKHPDVNRRMACLLTILGILVSFWVLCVIAITLKNSGKYFGLGLNFQHPEFIIVLTLIITIFISSALGRLHIMLPAGLNNYLSSVKFQNQYLEHFLGGILAVILSTPCNAPFLGSAMAVALAGSNMLVVFVFTFVAIGFSLPYILLMLSPNIIKFLPKSGKKLMFLKNLLVLLLIGTLVWLILILWQQMDLRSVVLVVGFIILLKFIIEQQDGYLGIFVVKIALISLIFSGAVTLPKLAYLEDQQQQQEFEDLWQTFSKQKLDQYIRSGRVVFVDITADWCITCKYNKFMVLDRTNMLKFFASNNVVLMKGDVTNPDANIEKYMIENHVQGIPYNKVYGPSAPGGIELPIILKFDDIKSAVMRSK